MDHSSATTTDLAPNLALPWVLRLRYGMVALEAGVVLGMAYGFGLEIPIFRTLAVLAAALASNILLGRLEGLLFRRGCFRASTRRRVSFSPLVLGLPPLLPRAVQTQLN